MKGLAGSSYYQNDERVFPAHFHAANLMELLQQRDISSHLFLKKTRLFYEDIMKGQLNLSAQQFCQIIENAQALYPEPELSFRWGHGLFPGHFDAFSQLLCHSQTLDDLLNTLCRYGQLTPMMNLQRWEDGQTVYLQWSDAIGLGKQHSFLVEAYSTAIMSLANWFYAEKLPWRFAFSIEQPKHIEEYEVNLGPNVQFDLGLDLIMIDRCWLDQKIPDVNRKFSSEAACAIAQSQCENELKRFQMGFIQLVHSQQLVHLPDSISLNDMAQLLEMSPATFKRKLSKHHFNYQRIQDLARLSISLQLIQKEGFKNVELADYLKIKDVNNFRRAFKRWCGMTPAAIKEKLMWLNETPEEGLVFDDQ